MRCILELLFVPLFLRRCFFFVALMVWDILSSGRCRPWIVVYNWFIGFGC